MPLAVLRPPSRPPAVGEKPAVGPTAGAAAGPLRLPEIAIDPSEGIEDSEVFERVNALQVRYQPVSRINPTGAVIPAGMAHATRRAVLRIQERHGDIDAWVRSRLQYTPEEMSEALTSEQIDAVALGIDCVIDRPGAGMILADMAGFGKGRIIAAINRAVLLSGGDFIFFTEKANLFSDYHRDVRDTGSDEIMGRPFMLNDGSKITDASSSEARIVWPAWRKGETGAALKGDGLPAGCRTMLSSYSQFNRTGTLKTDFLARAARGAYLALDESHNFVGDSNTGKAISAAIDASAGSLFSSATYARDVTNLASYGSVFPWLRRIEGLDEMSVHHRRAIAEESVKIATEDGRIIRREHDLTNMVFTIPGVDDVTVARNEALADKLAPILSDMAKLARRVSMIVNDRNEENLAVKEACNSVQERKAARELWFAANFGGRLNGIVGQFVIALKVDDCVQQCIDTLLMGEKPVVVIDATMESLMRELSREASETDPSPLSEDDIPVSDEDAVVSDTARPPTFRDALAIMCDRLLQISLRKGLDYTKMDLRIRDPLDVRRELDAFEADPPKDRIEAERRRTALEAELGVADLDLLDAQRAILAEILTFPDISLSPIDDIRERVEAEGARLFHEGRIKKPWVSDEISGRCMRIVDGKYVPVPAVDRNQAVARYNNGGSNLLLITRAGSTGLSIHDSEKFADHARRHMMELRSPSNVIERQQTWFRVFRRGQLTKPRYSTLLTGLPFEAYDTAIANRKLIEASASVTGTGSNAVTLDAPDPINAIGNEVAQEFLLEHLSLAETMGIGMNVDKEEADREFYFVGKLLKRLPLLRIDMQKRVFAGFMAAYQDRLRSGAVAHHGHDLPGTWVPVRRHMLIPGDGGADPIDGRDVTVTTIATNREARPLRAADVIAMASAASSRLGENPFAAHEAEIRRLRMSVLKAALNERKYGTVERALVSGDENQVKRARDKLDGMLSLLSRVRPGSALALPNDEGDPMEAVVVDVRAPLPGKQSILPREYEVVYALPGEETVRSISLAGMLRMPQIEFFREGRYRLVMAAFDRAPAGTVSVERKVLDGNIIGAVLASRRMGCGTKTTYTDGHGARRTGILVPRSRERDLPVQVGVTVSPSVALAVIRARGGRLMSAQRLSAETADLREDGRGGATLVVPPHKRGTKDWETDGLVAITGKFTDSGNSRCVRIPANRMPAALHELARIGFRFHYEARHRDVAIAAAALLKAPAPGEPEPAMPSP